jgi:hypothetical protein
VCEISEQSESIWIDFASKNQNFELLTTTLESDSGLGRFELFDVCFVIPFQNMKSLVG